MPLMSAHAGSSSLQEAESISPALEPCLALWLLHRQTATEVRLCQFGAQLKTDLAASIFALLEPKAGK